MDLRKLIHCRNFAKKYLSRKILLKNQLKLSAKNNFWPENNLCQKIIFGQ